MGDITKGDKLDKNIKNNETERNIQDENSLIYSYNYKNNPEYTGRLKPSYLNDRRYYDYTAEAEAARREDVNTGHLYNPQEKGDIGWLHTDYGKSYYDEYASTVSDLQDLNEVRAREQGFISKIGGGLGKFATITAAGTVGNIVGTLAGIAEGFSNAVEGDSDEGNGWNRFWTGFWSNKVNTYMNDIIKSAEDAMPVYESKAYQNAGFLDRVFSANFLSGFIANMGWTSSAILSTVLTGGMGAASLGSSIARSLGASKNAANWVYRLVGACTGSMAEASTEAINNYDEAKQDYYNLVSSDYRNQKAALDAEMQQYYQSEIERWGLQPKPEQEPIMIDGLTPQESLWRDVQNQYAERYAQLERDYERKLATIEDNATKAGTNTFGANAFWLTLSNSMGVFSNISTPMSNINRVARGSWKNIFKAAGQKEGISRGELLAREALEAISQGNEEMVQKGAAETAKAYYGQYYNPEFTGQMRDYFDIAGEQYANVYKDPKDWEEFASGMFLGISGAAGAGHKSRKTEDGKVKQGVGFEWTGGLFNAIKESKEVSERSKQIYDDANKIYNDFSKDKNLQARARMVIGVLADKDEMAKAVDNADKKAFLDREGEQWIRICETFSDIGRMNDLKAMVGQKTDMTDEELREFAAINSEEIKDDKGNGTGRFKSGLPVVDANGELLTNSPDGIKQLRERMQKDQERMNKVIDTYQKTIEDTDAETGYSLSRDQLKVLTWAKMKGLLAEDRQNKIGEELNRKLNWKSLYDAYKNNKTYRDDDKNNYVKFLENEAETLSDIIERYNALENGFTQKSDVQNKSIFESDLKKINQILHTIAGDKKTKEGESKDSLDTKDNKSIVDSFFELLDENTKGTLLSALLGQKIGKRGDESIYFADVVQDILEKEYGDGVSEILDNINDLIKLSSDTRAYDKMFREFVGAPQKIDDMLNETLRKSSDANLKQKGNKIVKRYNEVKDNYNNLTDFFNNDEIVSSEPESLKNALREYLIKNNTDAYISNKNEQFKKEINNNLDVIESQKQDTNFKDTGITKEFIKNSDINSKQALLYSTRDEILNKAINQGYSIEDSLQIAYNIIKIGDLYRDAYIQQENAIQEALKDKEKTDEVPASNNEVEAKPTPVDSDFIPNVQKFLAEHLLKDGSEFMTNLENKLKEYVDTNKLSNIGSIINYAQGIADSEIEDIGTKPFVEAYNIVNIFDLATGGKYHEKLNDLVLKLKNNILRDSKFKGFSNSIGVFYGIPVQDNYKDFDKNADFKVIEDSNYKLNIAVCIGAEYDNKTGRATITILKPKNNISTDKNTDDALLEEKAKQVAEANKKKKEEDEKKGKNGNENLSGSATSTPIPEGETPYSHAVKSLKTIIDISEERVFFDEDSHKYFVYLGPDTKKAKEQFESGTITKGNAKENDFLINDVSPSYLRYGIEEYHSNPDVQEAQKIGNEIDLIIRDYFSGIPAEQTKKKLKFLVREEDGIDDTTEIYSSLNKIKEEIQKIPGVGKNCSINTNPLKLVANYNGDSIIAGTPDMIVIGEDGIVRIFDMKAKKLDNLIDKEHKNEYGETNDYERYQTQLFAYAQMLKANGLNVDTNNAYLIQFKTKDSPKPTFLGISKIENEGISKEKTDKISRLEFSKDSLKKHENTTGTAEERLQAQLETERKKEITSQIVSNLQSQGITVHSKNEMEQYIKEHGLDNVGTFSRENDDIRYFTTPEGEIYGFVTPDDEIYIDETKISPEHLIHEYTNLWDKFVREKNPKLWQRGVGLMKQIPLWNEIANSEQYGQKWAKQGKSGINLDNLIASEVHARLVGKSGANILDDLSANNNTKNIVSRLKKWLLDFWKNLKSTFSKFTKEELNAITLDEFNSMPLRDFVDKVNLRNAPVIGDDTPNPVVTGTKPITTSVIENQKEKEEKVLDDNKKSKPSGVEELANKLRAAIEEKNKQNADFLKQWEAKQKGYLFTQYPDYTDAEKNGKYHQSQGYRERYLRDMGAYDVLDSGDLNQSVFTVYFRDVTSDIKAHFPNEQHEYTSWRSIGVFVNLNNKLQIIGIIDPDSIANGGYKGSFETALESGNFDSSRSIRNHVVNALNIPSSDNAKALRQKNLTDNAQIINRKNKIETINVKASINAEVEVDGKKYYSMKNENGDIMKIVKIAPGRIQTRPNLADGKRDLRPVNSITVKGDDFKKALKEEKVFFGTIVGKNDDKKLVAFNYKGDQIHVNIDVKNIPTGAMVTIFKGSDGNYHYSLILGKTFQRTDVEDSSNLIAHNKVAFSLERKIKDVKRGVTAWLASYNNELNDRSIFESADVIGEIEHDIKTAFNYFNRTPEDVKYNPKDNTITLRFSIGTEENDENRQIIERIIDGKGKDSEQIKEDIYNIIESLEARYSIPIETLLSTEVKSEDKEDLISNIIDNSVSNIIDFSTRNTQPVISYVSKDNFRLPNSKIQTAATSLYREITIETLNDKFILREQNEEASRKYIIRKAGDKKVVAMKNEDIATSFNYNITTLEQQKLLAFDMQLFLQELFNICKKYDLNTIEEISDTNLKDGILHIPANANYNTEMFFDIKTMSFITETKAKEKHQIVLEDKREKSESDKERQQKDNLKNDKEENEQVEQEPKEIIPVEPQKQEKINNISNKNKGSRRRNRLAETAFNNKTKNPIFRGKTGKHSIHDLLDKINSPIAKLLKSVTTTTGTITVLSEEDFNSKYGQGVRGIYSPEEGVVVKLSSTNNDIIHELCHLTVPRMLQNEEAAIELKEVFNQYKEYLKLHPNLSNNISRDGVSVSYATNNLYEFLSELFSNNEVANILKSIPSNYFQFNDTTGRYEVNTNFKDNDSNNEDKDKVDKASKKDNFLSRILKTIVNFFKNRFSNSIYYKGENLYDLAEKAGKELIQSFNSEEENNTQELLDKKTEFENAVKQVNNATNSIVGSFSNNSVDDITLENIVNSYKGQLDNYNFNTLTPSRDSILSNRSGLRLANLKLLEILSDLVQNIKQVKIFENICPNNYKADNVLGDTEYINGSIKDVDEKVYKILKTTMEKVSESLLQQDNLFAKEIKDQMKYMTEELRKRNILNKFYGVINPVDFITKALTHQQFIGTLSTIKYSDNSSVLDKTMKALLQSIKTLNHGKKESYNYISIVNDIEKEIKNIGIVYKDTDLESTYTREKNIKKDIEAYNKGIDSIIKSDSKNSIAVRQALKELNKYGLISDSITAASIAVNSQKRSDLEYAFGLILPVINKRNYTEEEMSEIIESYYDYIYGYESSFAMEKIESIFNTLADFKLSFNLMKGINISKDIIPDYGYSKKMNKFATVLEEQKNDCAM